MAVLTDDCDIRQNYFRMQYGGNGDYYITILEYDGKGQWQNTADFRCAMSGGNCPHEVKMAIANLYRAMETAGLNQHPKDDILTTP